LEQVKTMLFNTIDKSEIKEVINNWFPGRAVKDDDDEIYCPECGTPCPSWAAECSECGTVWD